MNAQERKTLNRAQISKDKWKAKARERQKNMRLLQLKIRDLERSRHEWKTKYYGLKSTLETSHGETSKSADKPLVEKKADRKKN